MGMTKKEMESLIEKLNKRIAELEGKGSELKETLYTIQEVADMFGVTREAIYQRISRGEIPAIKLGTLHVRAVDLEEILGKAI